MILGNLGGARAIVLVDGDCALCHGFTMFVAARDKHDRVRFATQQSEEGRYLLKLKNQPMDLKTIVCMENQGEDWTCYKESTAVLRTMRHLDGLWPLLSIFLWIPPIIRDAVYRLVARSRYRVFGKTSSCRLPDIKTRKKVLGMASLSSSIEKSDAKLHVGVEKLTDPSLFESYILQDLLTVCYFTASWCGPCQLVSPQIEDWVKQNSFGPETKFLKIDVDKMRPVAKRYKVKTMPQFLLFRKGALLGRHIGTNTGELRSNINRFRAAA
ncbi:hypothetical protein AAMO2058_001123800 [Amorphochlora amoebiformis]|uniref:Thioredoxin domain-containing protein n=1 Tax=Amorphochlora amoebiformis TaxID=1561963 RepID=A0A7S0GWK2_9EUKA|mmetsp:Transcript_18102/g.28829  ORF Transcript_18102/g.28829 Transcript_18102/m.28829 type:complete len:269 (+) Transcript_18102:100-906(+)